MPPQFSRRAVLGASALGGVAAVIPRHDARAHSATPGSRDGRVTTIRWLGNNGWELRSDGQTVLIDPWLTRFRTGTYTPAGADPNTPITVDRDLIDTNITTADLILVTHGHYDHLPDIPHIAERTGATVLGTETHCNLLRALGAPPSQLSVVRGGERLRFGAVDVTVVPSLHSATGPRARVAFPGTVPSNQTPKPLVIADLLEGGTLAYHVTIGGFSVMNFGGANYIPHELRGLRPDCLLLPVGGAAIPRYVDELFDLLGHPRFVLPTHWDDFDIPFNLPARDAGGLQPLRQAVAKASPRSKFIVPEHNETVTF